MNSKKTKVPGRRFAKALGVPLAVLAISASTLVAEEAPRTSWGVPDLQGTWDFRSVTPFERPESFKDKEFLTRDEVEAFEEAVRNARADRAAADPVYGQGDVDVGYNSFWLDMGDKMTGTMRTSLVVDPPDGRVPAITEDARRRAAQRYTLWGRVPEGPEDRNPFTRCIMGFNSGPPMNPGAYNNLVEIFQEPGTVALVTEMVNDHRVIPLDGRPHVHEDIRLWKGDSRGYWDGDTLVVTTKNFSDETNFRGSGRNMILTERFERTSEGTLLYGYTIEDPDSFAAPWSVEIEMRKTEDPLLEYACHEGNRAMHLMLSGAREQEKRGENNEDWLATWYGGQRTVDASKKRLEEAEGAAESSADPDGE